MSPGVAEIFSIAAEKVILISTETDGYGNLFYSINVLDEYYFSGTIHH